MKIVSHLESHIVELDDGTRWQLYPGDLDITLGWKPETELRLIRIDGDVSELALVTDGDTGRVRVLPEGESWREGAVQADLGSTKRSQRRTGN